jgi:hypothetical protein
VVTATFTELALDYLATCRGLGYRRETYLRGFAGFLDCSGQRGAVPLWLSVQSATATSARDPSSPGGGIWVDPSRVARWRRKHRPPGGRAGPAERRHRGHHGRG